MSTNDDNPKSHNVISFIKAVKSNRFLHLPTHVPEQDCSVIFRKPSDDRVDCIELPAAFGSVGTAHHFGRPLEENAVPVAWPH